MSTKKISPAKWKNIIARNLNGERAQALCEELGIKDPTFYTKRTRQLITWRASGAPTGIALPPESDAERRMRAMMGLRKPLSVAAAASNDVAPSPAPAVHNGLEAQVRNLLKENERLRDLYIDMAIREYDRNHAVA